MADEFAVNCSDYLAIYDGPDASSPLIVNTCGNDTMNPIWSSQNSLYLEFYSSGLSSANGFLLSWTSIDGR